MSNESAVVLKVGSNGGVVQLPGRKFPGMVIQGDSLSILRRILIEAKAALLAGDLSEVNDLLDESIESVDGRLMFYEQALIELGLPLPYDRA